MSSINIMSSQVVELQLTGDFPMRRFWIETRRYQFREYLLWEKFLKLWIEFQAKSLQEVQ